MLHPTNGILIFERDSMAAGLCLLLLSSSSSTTLVLLIAAAAAVVVFFSRCRRQFPSCNLYMLIVYQNIQICSYVFDLFVVWSACCYLPFDFEEHKIFFLSLLSKDVSRVWFIIRENWTVTTDFFIVSVRLHYLYGVFFSLSF